MKLRPLAIAVGLALASVGGTASAVIVGGINFSDTANLNHFENTTVYETVVNAPGDILSGYGVVTSVNGLTNYGANTYSLYFTFQYTVDSITNTLVQFSSGELSVYRLAQDALNFSTISPATALAGIVAGTPWLQLTGHDNVAIATPSGALVASGTELFGEGSVVGPAVVFSGRGLADVNLGWGIGAVEDFLNSDGIADVAGGFADIELTSTGSSTSPAPGENCTAVNGSLPTGEYCISGSTNLKGFYVPEPASMALFGIGLLGMAAFGRRRSSNS